MPERLPVIGVMGSSVHEHRDLAEPLGKWLAQQGFHLLTGAGGGVMAAVSRAFTCVEPRRGMTIGIVPGSSSASGYEPRQGYPNPWVEIAVYTHLPLSGPQGTEPMSRNHINVLTPDAIVALPGAEGTASELELARRYGRPAIAFVRSPADIPGIPTEVPMTADLEEVYAFVRRNVNSRATSDVTGYRQRKKLI
jgi:uncharacterized protein (TIGR00725 family)